jgi:hypothetical protein
MRTWLRLWTMAVLAATGCGGGDDGGDRVDPRCASVCAVHEPDLDGAFDVCSPASADQCEAECSARIAETTSLCASCLLEESCFDTSCEGTPGGGDDCDSTGQCTVHGREGSCTYTSGDQGAYDDCLRQVYPRRAVECSAEYRPVVECASVCGAGDAGAS